ncbi:unnamed protein product [Allacma fusca]|uniref:Uncharacterized protein n=1 Tax=Allacma fusca TaxID=39272 RepID=A0A8J2JWV9_9HEXA|nr:unnamed protein product [Allacma fusca]
MKSMIYWVLMVAVIVAVVAPWVYAAPEDAEEPESLLSNMEGGASDSKPFNLQSANGQRRAHGIYFNGR